VSVLLQLRFIMMVFIARLTKSKNNCKKVLTNGYGCGILFRLSTSKAHKRVQARKTDDHRQAKNQGKAKAIKFKPQVKRRKPLPVNGKEENKTNREKNLKNF